jgi:flagellar M-ring protein FliF
MNIREILNQVLQSLKALDKQKKTALGAGFVVILAAIIFASFYISKPVTAPLYANLSQEDVNSISRVLSENRIDFVISTDGASVEVPIGSVTRSRMLLAENGLPTSEKTGYELFDQVNTLGLTSFMQGVTSKRAIEGELVRTIQMINGVNSARVHLVIQDRNLFRRGATNNSSASVVLKTFGKIPGKSITSIRHLVAAAVPGLDTGNVTIVGSDGSLMTTKDDLVGGSTKLVELEREYERDVEEKIALALGAHIGVDNLRISASVKLNSDKRRVEEVVYDPDSRIERSVQIVREAGTTENKESANPVTIDQNLPEEEVGGASGQSSSENNERREELTNYEINEKKISLVSDGYMVESMSVAVLVNKERLTELLGENAGQAALDAKREELQQIVSAAASISDKRGDRITVNLVEFMDGTALGEIEQGNAVLGFLGYHFGSILNMLGLIIAAVLFSVLGIRPLLAFLNKGNEGGGAEPSLALTDDSPFPDGPSLLDDPNAPLGLPDASLAPPSLSDNSLAPPPLSAAGGLDDPFAASAMGNDFDAGIDNDLAQLAAQETRIRKQLEQMVGQSEERTVIALKHWLQQDGVKATA